MFLIGWHTVDEVKLSSPRFVLSDFTKLKILVKRLISENNKSFNLNIKTAGKTVLLPTHTQIGLVRMTRLIKDCFVRLHSCRLTMHKQNEM